jgi:hypothetical protein
MRNVACDISASGRPGVVDTAWYPDTGSATAAMTAITGTIALEDGE